MKRQITLTVFLLLAAVFILLDKDMPPCPNAVLKALPSLFLMVSLFCSRKMQPSRSEWLLPFLALFFSIIGDTAGEMHLGKMTLPIMMLFFGIAHIFYISSFLRHSKVRKKQVLKIAGAVIIATYATCLLRVLSSRVSDGMMMTGIVVYAILLGLMCITCLLQERRGLWLMFAGAILFLMSDSMLVLHRFVFPIPARSVLVMATYYAAQLLINIPVIHKAEK